MNYASHEKFKEVGVTDFLRRLLGSEDADVRKEAALALANYDATEVLKQNAIFATSNLNARNV